MKIMLMTFAHTELCADVDADAVSQSLRLSVSVCALHVATSAAFRLPTAACPPLWCRCLAPSGATTSESCAKLEHQHFVCVCVCFLLLFIFMFALRPRPTAPLLLCLRLLRRKIHK